MNDKYLLKLWVVAIVLLLLTVYAIFFVFIPIQNYLAIMLAVFIIGVNYIIYQAKKVKIERLFRISSLDDILRYYDKTIKPSALPEGKFLKSYSKAIVMSLYGDFYDAYKEMSIYNMSDKVPMYRAMQLNAIALNNYLQKRDILMSLELSKQAKELSRTNKKWPGRSTAENAYSTYIEIGEILNGNFDDTLILQLEKRYSNSFFILKIQIAWALAIAYKKLNREREFRKMESYLKEFAPHCRPLFNFD
ncbi:MAG: hypothetical protein U0Y96_14465 [Candidatus Kapaibacterium sp.]|nr:hypothetical protein [Bacteroidota bacterium]